MADNEEVTQNVAGDPTDVMELNEEETNNEEVKEPTEEIKELLADSIGEAMGVENTETEEDTQNAASGKKKNKKKKGKKR